VPYFSGFQKGFQLFPAGSFAKSLSFVGGKNTERAITFQYIHQIALL